MRAATHVDGRAAPSVPLDSVEMHATTIMHSFQWPQSGTLDSIVVSFHTLVHASIQPLLQLPPSTTPRSNVKSSAQEVSPAHLVSEVDVQPSHLGSIPHDREFGFLLFQKKSRCRGFPYRIPFKKKTQIHS